jgi:hypothetical protein
VEIENNNASIFKDLRGTMRNAKLLKRNDEACKGILTAPSKLPQNSSFFSLTLKFQKSGILTHDPRSRVGFGPKFCGADGKPTLRLECDSQSITVLAHGGDAS